MKVSTKWKEKNTFSMRENFFLEHPDEMASISTNEFSMAEEAAKDDDDSIKPI